MKAIGFKASWHKEPKATKKTEPETIPSIVPGSRIATLIEIQWKINEHEAFIISKAFSRLKVEERKQTLEAYRFLTATMAAVTEPVNNAEEGFTDCEGLDVDYDME